MKKIKLALFGIGNCASSLIQGIEYYKENKEEGIITNDIGGYSITDIEVVCAFDVTKNKVGKPLSEAIFSEPNCTSTFSNVYNNVMVLPGVINDGLTTYNHYNIDPIEYKSNKEIIVRELIKSETEIAINYLPVGSAIASRFYADCCLEAGVSFINAIPEFITTDKEYQKKFEEAKLICIGDDIKSQVGATIIHRTLCNLVNMRGQKILNTYQLNFGGNTDFENMLDRSRLESKEKSKTQAVTSLIPYDTNIKVGPSDFVPFMKDRKICYINIEGEQFGGGTFEIELKLNVEDSPNSAGVMADAVRAVRVGLDRGLSGYIDEVASCLFKSPQTQTEDITARNEFLTWLDD